MATRTDRFMSAAVRAARRAKQWATVAGRVLRAAGRAALVAAVAAGIAAARTERTGRSLSQGRGR